MIGREYEIERLEASLKTNESELIAVYGRRRIGKTYLIRSTYEKHICFEVTGLYDENKNKQLEVFHDELKRRSESFKKTKIPVNWHDAFEMLKTYIEQLKGSQKKIIFIDELPWLDTHKSDFLSYFSHFWNIFCEKRKDLIVIICGSAASYMVQNIIKDKGSLHARITYKLQLSPFSLYETKLFLEKEKDIKWEHYNILHLYIALGGIPHYLNKVRKGQSVVQNIQRLCFDSTGDLINEFKEIFESLFSHSTTHIKIIRVLGKSQKGITREELINNTHLTSTGNFTKSLEELEASGFITEYPNYGKQTHSLYRLSDEYSTFYLKYIEPNKKQGADFWKTMSQNQTYITWAGFNFETICLKHISQIKRALQIGGVHSTNSSWSTKGAQIDLVIARKDNWINLCEMKFYKDEFKIGANDLKNLQNKVSLFRSETKTKNTIAVTMITTYGVEENDNYRNIVENSLTMDILFEK